MPRYRFTWDNFDDDTVAALAERCGYDPSRHDSARGWLANAVKRPEEQFIRSNKAQLETHWLAKHPRTAKSIVEHLLVDGIGPRTPPVSDEGYVDYIRKCRNTKTVRLLICRALIKFGDSDRDQFLDGNEGLDSPIPRFATLRPKELQPDSLKPHPYQEEVWQALDARHAEAHVSNELRGLIVMPTGSGKTFTLVRWLVQKHINQGGRVLWVAHRHDLLNQAAQTFHHAAFLAPNLPTFRVRIVSGVHCQPTTVGPEDHVVLWSIQSLARRPKNVEHFLAHDDVFLVVDEAHHAPAKSYRNLFDILKQRQRKLAVGLTATPTRTLEDERPVLARLFGDQKLCEIHVRDLVEQRYLARPYPEIVRTNISAEQGVTQDDIAHLERFGELSEAWQDRLANVTARNEIIVRRYQDHQQRYGKTLVFAVNIAHAQLLRDRFREAGVEAEYIASYRYDDENIDHAEVRERFRRTGSGLDVLINIDILTEGVDIPCIQTVFLTRPTRSEILLRQMIGRALRGPQVKGGTEQAYLVSFEDHWSEFSEWEHPFELVSDIMEAAPEQPAEEDPLPVPKPLVDAIPWELIKATVDELRRLHRPFEVAAFEAVPHGWYLLERDDDGEEVREVIHVYQHQHACWEALIDRLWRTSPRKAGTPESQKLHCEYFLDCDVPQPSRHHVGQVVQHHQAGGDKPIFSSFSQRSRSDPYAVAQEIIERKLDPAQEDTLVIQRAAVPLTKAIYRNQWAFAKAVDEAKIDLQDPKSRRTLPKAEVVFEPLPNVKLAPGPAHNLEALLSEVVATAKTLLHEKFTFNGSIRWTNRVLRNYFAQARWNNNEPPGSGSILVNCLLDSPGISADTMRFLLWHELLHLYLQAGHTNRFRELECTWPGHLDADRELDTLNERYGVFHY